MFLSRTRVYRLCVRRVYRHEHVLDSFFDYSALTAQIIAQVLGCTVLALGIAMEVRCGSITMPGEGIQVAISRVSGMPFAKTKIMLTAHW